MRVHTVAEQDFTDVVLLDGLQPETDYEYQVLVVPPAGEVPPHLQSQGSASGRFRSLPLPERPVPVAFVWGSDIGGQGRCRAEHGSYEIFDRMRDTKPDFAVLLGDVIYADNPCPSPPNIAGSDFVASSLDEFRRKHRYQREDSALQRLLGSLSVYAIWDDHEVRNDFSGQEEFLMSVGRKALLEYWPIRRVDQDPHRLYRSLRIGSTVELFLLDTRQYRSPNHEPDGSGKTMLGSDQLGWLMEGLVKSTATWKVIATSVPLSIRKGGSAALPGNDSWALGEDGTGFHHELRSVVNQILEHRIHNVVWIAGDVHFAQVNGYDPDQDGETDFYEFISGPLSAATVRPRPPQPDLHPTTLYAEGEFLNFGLIRADSRRLTVELIDALGATRFQKEIPALTGK